MILKLCFLYLAFITLDVKGQSDYTYNTLAGGWFKMPKPAAGNDAAKRFDSEGAILVLPVNNAVLDAVNNYLIQWGKKGLTAMRGVNADFTSGDYYSIEGQSGYTYDNLAGGWFKLHKPAARNDAAKQCDSEGAILVSPVNSQVRDAVNNYLIQSGKGGLTIMSGVKVDFTRGEYISIEGVPLTKMPVLIQSKPYGDPNSGESCVQWLTHRTEVAKVKCTEVLPFVCFKKNLSLKVAGCATKDPEYKYDERSGSCYKFHTVAQSWPNANIQCKEEQGYLAVVNNRLENIVLTELFAKYPDNAITGVTSNTLYAMLGFRDWLDGKSWKTVTGQTLAEAGYAEWANGEPNDEIGIENCGSLFKKGQFNDVPCDYKYAFICEKQPDILYS